MSLDPASLALRYAISKNSDLSPPLGYPGGSCQVIERVTQNVPNQRKIEELVAKVEAGEALTNAEASLIYDREKERGARGTRFKGVFLTTHAQYRMDLRGITVGEVLLSLQDFHKAWANEKSRDSSTYRSWERAIQRSDEIRWEANGLILVFFAASLRKQNIWAAIISVYPRGGRDPGQMNVEDCQPFAGWSDLSAKRVVGRAKVQDWMKWVVQPFEILWKHHREFVRGPVDDAMDTVIRELAPELVTKIREVEVDEDVDEFVEGASYGAFDATRLDFPDPPKGETEDWGEGYSWGFGNPEALRGGRLPPRVKKKVVEEAIQEFKGNITEEVAIAALEKVWKAVSPKEVLKEILEGVRRYGWKFGAVFGLYQVLENTVLPAVLYSLTGDARTLGVGALPIAEVLTAATLALMKLPKDVIKAAPEGHLDWYEEKFGPVRLASSGDCYDANGRWFMNEALFTGKDSNLLLVQGEVTGQGALEGVQYGHCWIEDGNTVIDKSNGRDIRMPKAVYYALGHIGDNVYRYSPELFKKKLLQYKHWGPWDLKTSTGL